MTEREADITLSSTSRLEEYITRHGMRRTPERAEVLRLICQIRGIFNLEELAAIVQEKAAFSISRSTLFNTLELFCQAQIVIKHTMTRTAHYELNIHPHPRMYLVCTGCGTIRQRENKMLHRYLAAIRTPSFAVRQPLLYMYGLCKACAAAQKRKEYKEKKNQ